jgi:parallel beta-helix repeat protein
VNPGDSIQAAINSAYEGDTIFVKAGNYYESIVINKTVNIVGENAETTVIDGNGTTNYIFHVIANNVTIENFTLKSTNPDPNSYSCAIRTYNVVNVTAENLLITDVVIGIDIRSSNFTKILSNQIRDCKTWALRIWDSSCNNTVSGNSFENNPTAIFFADNKSKFSIVYHNNFINNPNNVEFYAVNYFDNGCPSGGNYWSNFTSIDLYSGPDQNETGSDGIFDKGYPSPDEVLDRYPLANPLTMFEVMVEGERFIIKVFTNAGVNSCIFNKENKTLTLSLPQSENVSYSCRVIIPKILLSCDSLKDWIVSAESNAIDYMALDDEDNTYIYFAYNYANIEEITIVGTRAVPELNFIVAIAVFFSLTALLIALKRFARKSE